MNLALVITQEFDPNAGGVQRTTSKLAKIFELNNHNVIIISFGKHTSTKEDFEGIPLFYVNQKEESYLQEIFHTNQISCIINQEGNSVRLTRVILRTKPPFARLINTLRINPLNFYSNNENLIQEFFNRKRIGLMNTYISRKIILVYHVIKQNLELRYIVKNTDAFVLLSERFIKELFFLAPTLKRYTHKIHGIGNPFNRPDIEVKNLPKENVILFVGRLNITQKRVDLLLQIWKRLHTQVPQWQFWVLGDGEQKEFMEQFCSNNNMNRVTFFGKVNPNEFYKKAKIFHMTSAFEGFGNVLIEAQSYGCVPILFDSYSSASEIIDHNKNGLVIQKFDVDSYTSQTKYLIENTEKINYLSENAFENVLRFSFEETYRKWNKLFNSF
jgi:glycosyltransferase involved in cell wall biosynthesis